MNTNDFEKTLVAFTDGSSLGNPGPGGWGAVIFDNDNNQTNISEIITPKFGIPSAKSTGFAFGSRSGHY